MFNRSSILAFFPFIFGIVLYSVIAWKNAQVAPVSPLNPQNTITPKMLQPDKKMPMYFIGFDIQLATGIPEADIETYVKNPKKYYKPCELNFSDFKQMLDNDLTGIYTPSTYQPQNVRAKFLLDNTVYYIDYNGLLNQPIEGFTHINKQQIAQLIQATCNN